MKLYFCSILIKKIRTLRLSDYNNLMGIFLDAPDSSKEMQSKNIEDSFLNGPPEKGEKRIVFPQRATRKGKRRVVFSEPYKFCWDQRRPFVIHWILFWYQASGMQISVGNRWRNFWYQEYKHNLSSAAPYFSFDVGSPLSNGNTLIVNEGSGCMYLAPSP